MKDLCIHFCCVIVVVTAVSVFGYGIICIANSETVDNMLCKVLAPTGLIFTPEMSNTDLPFSRVLSAISTIKLVEELETITKDVEYDVMSQRC